jgi:predicted Na+-dependent transporter
MSLPTMLKTLGSSGKVPEIICQIINQIWSFFVDFRENTHYKISRISVLLQLHMSLPTMLKTLGSSGKVPEIICQIINQIWSFLVDFRENTHYKISRIFVLLELRCFLWTDRQTDGRGEANSGF